MLAKSQKIALFIAGSIVLGALILLLERGGLIAWSALLVGIALLVKIWGKPAKVDVWLSVGAATLFVVTWFGALYYVISTWESGEVVELVIDTNAGPHTARLWVLDHGEYPFVYYDAEPEVADALLAGKPVRLTRQGLVSTRLPKAVRVDALPEAEANQILEVMGTKYGDRNFAATIFYALLGSSRDRIDVVVSLTEE